MGYFEAFLYGAVQGLTEYLPVSSSAHLALLPRFLNSPDPGLAFDVFLHLGTLIATLAYFRKDWMDLARTLPGIGHWFPQRNGKEAAILDWKWVAYGTIPALVSGALLHKWVESSFRGNGVIAGALAVGGVLLYVADRYCRNERVMADLGKRDAWIVGFVQCLSLVPGFSRSGSTIMAGRFLHFDRTTAARFSFLLSAPVTAAALLFELRHWRNLFSSGISVGPLILTALSSFAFGWIAIGGLLRLVRSFGYLGFAVYRVLLACVILGVLGL